MSTLRSEISDFDRIMKCYYAGQYEKIQKVNGLLWNIVVDLVRAIAESEYDGSGINDLKKVGDEKTNQLRTMLEREMAPVVGT